MSKPYRPATYSQQAPQSCISIENQAREYALWLMRNDRHHCAVYPLKGSASATSNRFRKFLGGFTHRVLRFIEVDPGAFLGAYREEHHV